MLADMLVQSGDWVEAVKLYWRAHTLDPTSPSATNRIIHYYALLGMDQEVDELSARLRADGDTLPGTFVSALLQGDSAEATARARRARPPQGLFVGQQANHWYFLRDFVKARQFADSALTYQFTRAGPPPDWAYHSAEVVRAVSDHKLSAGREAAWTYEIAMSKALPMHVWSRERWGTEELAALLALSGQSREAAIALERAAEHGYRMSRVVDIDPAYDLIRSDTLFHQVVESMRLKERDMATELRAWLSSQDSIY